MTVAHELHEQIRAYLAGRSSANELSGWLATCADEIDQSGDRDVQELADRSFIVFAEVSNGHRDESEARRELRRALEAHNIPPPTSEATLPG